MYNYFLFYFLFLSFFFFFFLKKKEIFIIFIGFNYLYYFFCFFSLFRWEHPNNCKGGKFAAPCSEGQGKALKTFLQLCIAIVSGKVAEKNVILQLEIL